MKAENRRLTEIINGNRQFIIPVFQRDYSWTPEQCRDMWGAIRSAGSGNSGSGHFMGSIVYVAAGVPGATFQSWLVIDGQQRLTTLTLLLAALRDCIKNSSWSGGDDSPTVDRINDYFLKNTHETGRRHYKLVLRRADHITLQTLIDGSDATDLGDSASERILSSYNCFMELLQSSECDFDEVYRGIGRLIVVDVILDRESDNPQLVFESMNSTGVSLRQSDLVRNYLLMELDDSAQTQLYDKCWSKIERCFKGAIGVFDEFLRDYMALKTGSTQQTRLDRVYDTFKDFWRPNGENSLNEMLDDMARVARTYASFRGTAPMQRPWLAEAMGNMRDLNTTQGLVVMRLYECHRKEWLSKDEFLFAIRLIESYLLRRAVLGLQTRGYWSLFARIAHEIDEKNALSSLQVAMARLRDNNRFPTDDEFSRALQEHNLYELRICKHILDRLENANEREPSPVEQYSIEHIMPQRIEHMSEWQTMLGGDWQDIQAIWLHRLGNLTLTAYNNTYSNRPFLIKREMEKGFQQSAVRLNQYVRKQERWTHIEIRERGSILARRALEIWPFHGVDEAHIQAIHTQELRERAAARSAEELKMRSEIERLVRGVLSKIQELGEIIEVIEHKSVCCYGPGLFAELLPMETRLRMLLPLDYNEIETPSGISVEDSSTWKFVPNRMHSDCDLLIDITEEHEIGEVMPMIRQAHDRSQKAG